MHLLTLQIEQFNILHGLKIPLPPRKFACTVDEVVLCNVEAMEPMVHKGLGVLTIAEKRFMCKQAFGNQVGYAIGGIPGEMLSDSDLVVIFEYLQWQYMNPDVHMAQSGVVKLALCFGLKDQLEGQMALQDVKEMMQKHEHLILPVHTSAPLHWTFLVLHMEKESAKVLHVKYYDWLKGEATCRRNAQILLTMLTLDPSEGAAPTEMQWTLPQHCNHYRQEWKSNDCGFAAWQALENVFKSCRMEDDCGVRPTPRNWRKILKTLLDSLVSAQNIWKAEAASDKKPKHPVCIPGQKVEGAKAEPLKQHEKQFFSCSSCRWKADGSGCCYCNPLKHATLRAEKEKRSRQLAAALQKALDHCKALDLIPPLPEAAAPETVADSAGPHSGGGYL